MMDMSVAQILVSVIGILVFIGLLRHLATIVRGFIRLRGNPALQPSLIGTMATSIAPLIFPHFPPGTIGDPEVLFTPYIKAKSSIVCTVPLFDSHPTPHIWIAEPEAVKAIANDRYSYLKDKQLYEVINIFGGNIVGTEGSDWRRHRDVARPAFGAGNAALVWRVTFDILRAWFDELDQQLSEGGGVIVVDALSTMTRITLLVISGAGFGRHISWSPNDKSLEPPEGYRLSFGSALIGAVDRIVVKLGVPKWAYSVFSKIHIPIISSALADTELCYEQLKLHINEMIADGRESKAGAEEGAVGSDLLMRLVSANGLSEGEKLSDDELVSDIFVFLLGGHETSSNTLSFAFGLLALHPTVQEKLYSEAKSVFPTIDSKFDAQSYKERYPKLEYTLAVAREALRLFPPTPRLIRVAMTDSMLPAIVKGQQIQVHVPKGSYLIVDVTAVHAHPGYWGTDADQFRPERFIDTEGYQWPRDAYLPFGFGPRACIGQRFALAELVCVLANAARKYKIEPPEELRGLPHRQKWKKLLHSAPGLIPAPTNTKVRFSMRK